MIKFWKFVRYYLNTYTHIFLLFVFDTISTFVSSIIIPTKTHIS